MDKSITNNSCVLKQNPQKKRKDKCFVPMCTSNSTKGPTKLFLNGPTDPKLRKKWFKAAGREDTYSPKTIVRCCEDHFDLEKDVENWVKYKLIGGRLILKKDVVPHIFKCQNKVKQLRDSSAIIKRNGGKREAKSMLQRRGDGNTTNLSPDVVLSMIEDMSSDESDDDPSLCSDDDDNASDSSSTTETEKQITRLPVTLTCNSCKNPIRGFRYTCVECLEFNTCIHCEAIKEHPMHYMLRVPVGKLQDEVNVILEMLRNFNGSDSEREESEKEDTKGATYLEHEMDVEHEDRLTMSPTKSSKTNDKNLFPDPCILIVQETSDPHPSKRTRSLKESTEFESPAQALQMFAVTPEMVEETEAPDLEKRLELDRSESVINSSNTRRKPTSNEINLNLTKVNDGKVEFEIQNIVTSSNKRLKKS